MKTGGARIKEALNDLEYDENSNPISSDHLYMNGSEIFNFTIDVVPGLVKNILGNNNLSKEDISLFVFHQANQYMKKVGNTVSSTIPIALTEAFKEGILHGNVMLAGFGVGYSWGGCILEYD